MDDAERINLALLRRFGEIRREKGLSQEEVASRAGIDRSYIGLLEKGKRRPTLDISIRIAEALGQRLSKLLAEAEKSIIN